MKYLSLIAFAIHCAISSAVAEFSENLLHGLQGVGLEVRPLNLRSNKLDLDEATLETHVIHKLDDLKVKVLSASELELIPGRPFLELGVNLAHAQGPSHLYSVTLKLREMAALERPKSATVSMALSTWERESMGIANRPEAVLQTVDRMIVLFSEELHKMNVQE